MSGAAVLARAPVGPRPGKTWLDSVRSEAISFLKGDNNSPWAILAETVLGCVPILGQAIDARDVIKGLAEVASAPQSPMAWFNLVTAIIGIIPGGGDAVKRSARAVKSGTVQPDELLSLIRRFYKGDPEKLIREVVDPGKIVAKLDEILASPALRRHLSDDARKQVDFIRSEIGKHAAALKKDVDDWLTKGRRTSADTGPAAKATPGAPKAKPETQLREGSKTKGEHRGDATPTTPNAATLRTQRFKSLEAKVLGVLGEHMADYHCQEVKGWGKATRAPHDKGDINAAKLNDGGHLVQLWPVQVRGRGIDAVWKSDGAKPYAIIEAKASCDPTKSLRALLGEAKDKTESAGGTQKPYGGRQGRSGQKGGTAESETIRQTNGKVTQMGHGWVQRRLLNITLSNAKDKAALISDKQAAYSRHVLFFSIPQAVAHAEALIKLAAKQSVPHEFHAAHQATREWGDAHIDKVVDNRAGWIDEGRRR